MPEVALNRLLMLAVNHCLEDDDVLELVNFLQTVQTEKPKGGRYPMMKLPEQRDKLWRRIDHSENLWWPSASLLAISDMAQLWVGRRKGISDSEIRVFFILDNVRAA